MPLRNFEGFFLFHLRNSELVDDDGGICSEQYKGDDGWLALSDVSRDDGWLALSDVSSDDGWLALSDVSRDGMTDGWLYRM